MPYGKCVILEEETKELGTDLKTLTSYSRQKIVIKCLDCDNKIIRQFKGFKGLHLCKSIIDGKKKCFKCKQKKDVCEFSKNRSSHDGYSKCCKECYSNYGSVKTHYKQKTIAFKKDLKTYFLYKTSNLLSRCRQKDIQFDLEKNSLYEVYLKQNGKCYYTNIDIIHNEGYCKYNSISIDRKDPNKGYIKENIVLCCFCINSFKGDMNEKEFKTLLNTILPTLQKWSMNEELKPNDLEQVEYGT